MLFAKPVAVATLVAVPFTTHHYWVRHEVGTDSTDPPRANLKERRKKAVSKLAYSFCQCSKGAVHREVKTVIGSSTWRVYVRKCQLLYTGISS